MAKLNVREKIIEAGLAVIYAQGFNGCSVQDITETAGVPKGSFYNYFKSKEALAVEVLSAYKAAGDLSLLLDQSKAPLGRLHDYFKYSAIAFNATGFKGGCLMGNLGCELSDSSEPVRLALAQRFGNWRQAVARLLREGQSTGTVNLNIDADQMAGFLMNAWQGALIQMKVSKSGKSIDDFLEVAFAPLRPNPKA